MHTPCTLSLFNFDYTPHRAKQLVGRVIPKNQTTLTLSTCQLLAETPGCPESPPSSGRSPSGALTPTDRLQKVKAYIKLRSRKVTTCLRLISPPKTGITTASPPWFTFSLYTINPHWRCRVWLRAYHAKRSRHQAGNPGIAAKQITNSDCTREGLYKYSAFTLSRMTLQNNSLI